MHRRQFLQTLNAMGASALLPASVFYDKASSALTPASTQPLVAPTNAVEVADSGWDIPKVGVVAVGGLATAILGKLAGRLPYLGLSIAIDTDVHSLHRVKADRKLLLGDGKAPYLNPHAAHLAAQLSIQEIADALAGLDMVLLLAGMGGAAGAGIAPIVARILREQNILTLAFATLPFSFESQRRQQIAQAGIRELGVHVNALLPFPNETIAQVAGADASFASVSSQAPLAFNQLYRGILNPVCRPGWVNIDFEDLSHILLSQKGDCAFGFGSASGMDGAAAATRNAIDHPLLGQHRLRRASAALVAMTAPPGFLMARDSKIALNSVRKLLPQDAHVIYGTAYDDNPGNEMTVSVLASGIRESGS